MPYAADFQPRRATIFFFFAALRDNIRFFFFDFYAASMPHYA